MSQIICDSVIHNTVNI